MFNVSRPMKNMNVHRISDADKSPMKFYTDKLGIFAKNRDPKSFEKMSLTEIG